MGYSTSTKLALACIAFTTFVLIIPTVVADYALFQFHTLRPLSTVLGAIWLMLVAISVQLADATGGFGG